MRLLVLLVVLKLALCATNGPENLDIDKDDVNPLKDNLSLSNLVKMAVEAKAFDNPTGKLAGRTLAQYTALIDRLAQNSAKYFENSKFAAPIEKLVTVYCQNSQTQPTAVTPETIATVTNPSKGFIFVVPGWTHDHKAYFVEELTTAYFTHVGDVNICVVDYSPIAQTEPLQIAMPHSFDVAEFLTRYVRDVSKRYNVPYSMFTFIGHSLGCQISGNVGNYLNGELGAIFATDTCGPTCEERWHGSNDSLHAGSAKYVQTIGTNRNRLGALQFYGTQVFLPNNGGPYQPGCGLDSIVCPHYRAIDFLIASIDPKNVFQARLCESKVHFALGLCNDEPCDRMGIYASRQRQGTFYLTTKGKAPYANGEECPKGFDLNGAVETIMDETEDVADDAADDAADDTADDITDDAADDVADDITDDAVDDVVDEAIQYYNFVEI